MECEPNQSRTCTKCKETKEVSKFSPRKDKPKNPYNSWCKQCIRDQKYYADGQDPKAIPYIEKTPLEPAPNGLKYCSDCMLCLELKFFIPRKDRKNESFSSQCIPCQSIYRKKHKEYHKERYAKMDRDNHVARKYGLSIDEYRSLKERADNLCEICHQPESIQNNSLVVDHNHTTGAVRGLLCRRCNSVLGFVKDNVDILKQSIEYLQKSI